MTIDRGFTTMIPKPKTEEKKEYYFDNSIRFKFLKAEFSLSLKVRKL